MKQFMANLIKRLTSRKFLLTLSAALVLVANQQWTELVLLISAYIGVEGVGDAAERFQHEKTKQAASVVEDTKLQLGVLDMPSSAVDKEHIVPGNDIPMP